MLTGGGYSDKFKELGKDGNGKPSKSDPLRTQQLAARDRARKLSLETNRRRRALELKKRLEAQKEAKRREEVLEERRKKQQEATHKFQRLRKAPSPRTQSEKTSGRSYSSSHLQDGIHMAHGHRGDAYNGSRDQYYQHDTPDLEDALRLVSGYSSHTTYGSHTAPAAGYVSGSHTAPAGYVSGALYQHEYSQSDNSLHRKYGMDNNANITPSSGSSYHGYSTPATATTYASNHGMPVKQFQQDLQEQQRKFLEEQAKSLQEFNEEIMKETTPSVLERSDSLSSVDSLEEQPVRSKKEAREDGGYSAGTKPGGPAVTVNYYTQGHFTSPANTRGHHDQQPGKTLSNYEANTANGKLFVSQQRTLESSSVSNQKQASNELQIEETSETDIVSEAVEERKPALLHGSSYNPKSSLPRSYADVIGNQYLSKTEPWIPQSSYDTSHANSGHHSGAPSTAFDIGGISGTSFSRTRNMPAKPSATVFTVVPNTNGSNISHKAHHYVSNTQSNSHHGTSNTLSNSHYPGSNTQSNSHHKPPVSTSNRTKERAAMSGTKEQRGVQFGDSPNTQSNSHHPASNTLSNSHHPVRGVQFDDSPAATDKKAGNSTKKQLAKVPVKSILKKTPSDQPAKLGGFKVRDSLEISKSSSPGRKKSVRWTGVDEYNDQDVEENDTSALGNGYKDPPCQEEGETAANTQSRPMSSVSGRDNRVSSAPEKDKEPSKSRPSSYHNSSYATSYASKKQTESPSTTTATSAAKPVNARNVYKQMASASKNLTSTAVKNGAVHNTNGLRLEKTPTDAEINWLWDKVRTCLNNREDESPRLAEKPPTGQQSRQLASVKCQYIDGGRITANLRIMSPPQGDGSAQSRNNGVPRWRTSSDSGSYLRRTALLHQRQKHSAIAKGKGAVARQGSGHQQSGARQGTGQQQPVPSSSHQGPARTVTMQPSSHESDVSDSLLAFQRAEQLVSDNVPESDIAVAIDNHRSPGNHDKLPVSALSMEEQRILESLDRLNERLRSVTAEVAPSPYMAITPKPPPFGGGFRGRRPLSSKQQVVPADPVSLSRVRASSADRGNGRINHYN